MSMGSNFGIHRPTPQISPPPATKTSAASPPPSNQSASNNQSSTDPHSPTIPNTQNNTISQTNPTTNSVSAGTVAGDDRTQGQILSDFLIQLEDYSSTIPDAVTSHYLNSSGFETADPRIVRLISIAAQKFISDVANDALQHCKTRTNNVAGSGGVAAKNQKISKDRKYVLTMEDLTPALGDYGITVRKAQYFV